MSRYIPGTVPTESAMLTEFLRVELDKIARAKDDADDVLNLTTLYAPPRKYREGTLAKADGVTWNPGSGAGVYLFRASAWRFLG